MGLGLEEPRACSHELHHKEHSQAAAGVEPKDLPEAAVALVEPKAEVPVALAEPKDLPEAAAWVDSMAVALAWELLVCSHSHAVVSA